MYCEHPQAHEDYVDRPELVVAVSALKQPCGLTVGSEVAAFATRKTLFFSRVTSLTARATPELGT